MKTSTFLFATDLVDEGIDVVLERLEQANLDALTMACNYHHSRDVFESGTCREASSSTRRLPDMPSSLSNLTFQPG